MSPDMIVYRKPCHLPVELEHKAYWTIKMFNFNLDEPSKLCANYKIMNFKTWEMMHMRIPKFIKQESKIFMIIKFQEKYLRLVKTFCLIILHYICFLENWDQGEVVHLLYKKVYPYGAMTLKILEMVMYSK